MLGHVERIKEWDEWILIDDNTATSFIAEGEKVLSSLLQNAVVGRFFISNELFPGNYKGISRREETATKEKGKEEIMCWADFRWWFQGALPDPPGSESLFSSPPGHPVKGTPFCFAVNFQRYSLRLRLKWKPSMSFYFIPHNHMHMRHPLGILWQWDALGVERKPQFQIWLRLALKIKLNWGRLCLIWKNRKDVRFVAPPHYKNLYDIIALCPTLEVSHVDNGLLPWQFPGMGATLCKHCCF